MKKSMVLLISLFVIAGSVYSVPTDEQIQQAATTLEVSFILGDINMGNMKKGMRLGNGSEYQLLRFLGHHRDELEDNILRNTSIDTKLDYNLEWLDFPKNNKSKSRDGEYVGIYFLGEDLKKKLSEKWNAYWPQTGSVPNWDAIIHCSSIVPNTNLKDKWIIVEAKAHLKELESNSDAKNLISKDKIAKAFESTQKRFQINTQNSWFEKYYQLANRLAFINFMLDNGIECSLLNIYFINGWQDDPERNVQTVDEWKNKINDEYSYLGINDNAKEYISQIFVECSE
jgi:hypothetical protein